MRQLSLAAILAISAFTATAMADIKADGDVRAVYFSLDNGTNSPYAVGLGGSLGVTASPLEGLTVGAKFYTEQNPFTDKAGNLAGATSDDMYDLTGTGSVLGQAYAAYTLGHTTLKVGRQQIDSPLAGSDDIRIIPNLFEAALLINTDLPDTTLIAGHVNKMMGNDNLSGNTLTFQHMSVAAGVGGIAGDEGVNVAAAVYTGLPNTTLQAWYYDATEVLTAAYVQADTSWNCLLNPDIKMTGSLQYYTYGEQGKVEKALNGLGKDIDYDVFGAKLAMEAGAFGAEIAYNSFGGDKAKTVSVAGAWGGYPEFAYADEYWGASMGANMIEGDITKIGVSYDAGFGTFGAAYVMFGAGTANNDVDVMDITYSADYDLASVYVVYENQSFDAANIKDTDIIKLVVSKSF